MRKMIKDLLNHDPEITVVGTAVDGIDALNKIRMLSPHVVTLDVNMPKMDGLTTLQKIMEENPLPVIMVSSLTTEGAEATLKALDCGAVDYVAKPSGEISLDIEKIRNTLIEKIKMAAKANVVIHKPVSPLSLSLTQLDNVILIGASTGGPPAIEKILSCLPAVVPPILIVQHMPSGFTKSFANRLNKHCKFEVKEAEEGDSIQPSLALVAPGGYHMIVGKDKRVHLDSSPPLHGVRPAVDPMMMTAAEVFGDKTIGVLLTGMGRDGAWGMKAVKQHGGYTIVQDKKSCVVFGMPKAAIEEGCVDEILPLHKIPRRLIRLCGFPLKYLL
ncbi:chemotaxis response regulator protein-glutamate methylesterase [Candidatus Bathyarchaeota archaeon]|nr:chemotaxis response regulator protein-glutamate methylesterase [Candidatus Bathyarchaeota archaeon]